jgi:hypothetical protein
MGSQVKLLRAFDAEVGAGHVDYWVVRTTSDFQQWLAVRGDDCEAFSCGQHEDVVCREIGLFGERLGRSGDGWNGCRRDG